MWDCVSHGEHFETTDSVNDMKQTGRPRSVRKENTMNEVVQAFVETPTLSTHHAVWLLDVSDCSVRCAMKVIGLHMYHPRLLQTLTEDDPDHHMQFAEWYLTRSAANASFF